MNTYFTAGYRELVTVGIFLFYASLLVFLRDLSQLCPMAHSTAYSQEEDSPLQHIILGWEKPSRISPKHCRPWNCFPHAVGFHDRSCKCYVSHTWLCNHFHSPSIPPAPMWYGHIAKVPCLNVLPGDIKFIFYHQENLSVPVWWALLPNMAQRISPWLNSHFWDGRMYLTCVSFHFLKSNGC